MTLDALIGRLTLHPGDAAAPVRAGRPELAPRLAAGCPADDLPGRLAALFTLCAQAHRLAARLAVAAARGQLGAGDPLTPDDRAALRAATAREHVLRIAHDWPRALSAQADAPADGAAARVDPVAPLASVDLRACPLWQSASPPSQQMAELPAWLRRDWLGAEPDAWLVHAGLAHAEPGRSRADWWQAADRALTDWSAQHDSAPARLLAIHRPALSAIASPDRPLMPEPDGPAWAALATALARQPDFVAAPTLDGQALDSGCWSRLGLPHPPNGAPRPHSAPGLTAWQRLGSRWLDLLQLAAPGGDTWLRAGTLCIAPGQGLAWMEMARGLLVHWVRLSDDGRTVVAARVLAPTDWNGQATGTLAQGVATLTERDVDAARHLATAYDPCMPVSVAPAARTTAPQGTPHA